MLVEVEMRAWDDHPRAQEKGLGFENEGVRMVNVPDDNVVSEEKFNKDADAQMYLLEWVWHYGQNDFQPSSTQRSLMVGDVVRLYGRRFKVDNFGFSEVK